MPRPPLPVGTHGKIKITERASGGFVARTKYRDYDGVTRLVERAGATQNKAKNNLSEALRDRSGPARGVVNAETKFSDAAALWFAEVEASVKSGDCSPNTVDLYERQLRNHVLPALGALRLREVTTPHVDAFLADVRRRRGASTTKTIRSVVSGVMRLAARHGAVSTNPTRETRRISGGDKRSPRALTAEERTAWLAQLEGDEQAVRKDLPDLTRWMLATGVRIGEALAVSWDEIDLVNNTVDIEWKIVRVRGKGLQRIPRPKTDSGERTLPLPPFAVAMLSRRLLSRDDAAPLFPDSVGGWRDPSNTRRDLRNARGSGGFAWVTSHVFRKTCATILDEAGLSARAIADHLGHARPSLTQDVYMGRKLASRAAADALDVLADM